VPPLGAVYVELEQGLAFDDAVLAMSPAEVGTQEGMLRFRELQPGHVWFASSLFKTPGTVVRRCPRLLREIPAIISSEDEKELYEFESLRMNGPRPRPLFWVGEFENVGSWVTSAIAELTAVPNETDSDPRWLETVDDGEPFGTWRVRPEIRERVEQLAMLATDLLPDFIDGSIQPEFRVPTGWEGSPDVWLYFVERGGGERRWLDDFGRGAFALDGDRGASRPACHGGKSANNRR